MEYALVAPNGAEIWGTFERIPGVAEICTPAADKSGKISFDYAGSTDVDWNAQQTVTEDGQRLYVDVNGLPWTEDQLALVEVDR